VFMDKIFIVPANDLESVEIRNMLEQAGFKEGVDLFVTNQPWGASWEGLEQGIKDAISSVDPACVYGVELKGDSPYNNVDHHYYCDKNWTTGEVLYEDDRTRDQNGEPKTTSIEQVAAMIGVKLSIDQSFIAANDVGFVEGMEELGEYLKMTDDEITQKIEDIRMREHAIIAQVQGITPEMEQEAVDAIVNAEYIGGLMVVSLPHSKCTTVTDRIPTQQSNGGLLIVCADGEKDYYGPSEYSSKLHEKFGGWIGNTSQRCTFFGTTDAKITQQDIIDALEDIKRDSMTQDEQGDPGVGD
jgi:hypothetical protein